MTLFEAARQAFINDLIRQADEPRPGPYVSDVETPENLLIDGHVDIDSALRAFVAELQTVVDFIVR